MFQTTGNFLLQLKGQNMFWFIIVMAVLMGVFSIISIAYGRIQFNELDKTYDAKRIMLDMRSGDLSWDTVKNALFIKKQLDSIQKLKFSVKELRKLTPKKIMKAVEFHNKYTRGNQISFEKYINEFTHAVKLLPEPYRTAAQVVIQVLLANERD